MTTESVAANNYAAPPWSDSTTTDAHAAKVAALFREHNSALVSFLRARLRSEQDAREAAQEAYVKLLQLDCPGAVSFLRSYLFRIAANVATDRLRQRQVRRAHASVESFDDICEEHAAPERGVAATQELSFIRGCLFELPERWRDAFIRHRIRGESEVSIARALGVSERMVRNYLVQTLIYCRSRLDGCTVEQARERMRK
jgi:RNA polymerase sigma-70 factor (ECF subfamily)